MPSAKQQVLDLIRNLPDDVTYEEIQYKIHVFASIEKGLKKIEDGESYAHEEVKQITEKWLQERYAGQKMR